ncbi:sn-glycerol-3-phosphate ABC transporter ATP-binding protein UgpC [Novacetimonas hansenii]|uniref:ABC transporter ATP-binding protein n=2 Tax=Novacetimonas hansenii TaxID=436 RepID=A0ABQ0SIF5_NOVHA|nr:sn-glycerol-3-phosphate ABC transporter ATP-binding protein UgpC [Novacetimonas hansenii]EFG83429.1 ABC transporter related protein [Novacetimonas hansenii ATCC 23769]GAN84193.1 ABC transporter [Novacetimonas hansenii JCM 7643]GBQ54491.1 nitrate/sulfonate/bicarbonate transporter ATP-binding protein [Novacetimonas hansenii NRIC 0243]GEC64067.1 ABC transporter ATP-binding protein [Novacetimonas hansenii]
MTTLTLKNIRKSYGSGEIIRGVSLTVGHGEFTVFVGPSGCGKSTLLRMIAGLEEISGGDLLIDGQRVNDVGPAGRGLAMVFQSYALYPHMTVYQNMEFALKLAKIPRAERHARIGAVARTLQLEPYLQHRPAALSGGQRQRVAIGRAIVRNPRLFLFDEPLSNLDAALRERMRVELATLHRRLGATTIYVTHDQVEAMTLADRIVVLNKGVVEQVGAPLELYHHPRNLFVARFIGMPPMNLLPAHVRGADARGMHLILPDGGEARACVTTSDSLDGTDVTLGIRPEHICHIRPGPAGADAAGENVQHGRIMLVEHLGALSHVHVRLATGHDLIIQTHDGGGLSRDAPITFSLSAQHCQVFDSHGRAMTRMPLTAGAHAAGHKT